MIYCPLKTNQYGNSKECLQSSCAWWDKSKSCCAILSLAIKANFKEISNIANYITKESNYNEEYCGYGGMQEGL
jgi:hypothetical protein